MGTAPLPTFGAGSRAWYRASLQEFRSASEDSVLGGLTRNSEFEVGEAQRDAWLGEIRLLQSLLSRYDGEVLLEFAVPRMGRRIDAVLLISGVVFVVEFKVGEALFKRADIDQAWDYALDLKNFHAGSHAPPIVPLLLATGAKSAPAIVLDRAADAVYRPLCVTVDGFCTALDAALAVAGGSLIAVEQWASAPYRPTPTIVEAARALYAQHSVEAIARHDAGAINLAVTSRRIEELADEAYALKRKIICFVTGVPGAGKTLVGLNVATRRRDHEGQTHAVFLSGNGPLVAVLREALTRDEVVRRRAAGEKASKSRAANPVKAFIQNVHHFRDEALLGDAAPADHVVIFDEAQRAWNQRKTADFMKQRKNRPDFPFSEPAFLISYLDRHTDWAVIVCLVGGGQEIHTGEAGIGEWLAAVNQHFPHWHLYLSSQLTDSEYAANTALDVVRERSNSHVEDDLHLAVSMRSFRAEHVSGFVKAVLDCDQRGARAALASLQGRFPIVLTRELPRAKQWIRTQARGNERFGLVASSKAMRLKPHAIDIRVAVDPVHWFLNDRDDTRSSYYLEDCATEFQVQGLELDWICVNWDGDLRFSDTGWSCHDFRGNRWTNINNVANQQYLRNAYRVLLTRARQGMVVFVPAGESTDPTRRPEYYDATFQYLADLGIPVLEDIQA
ncbi:MAG: DUF2075 domain-containing protein [Proteobacteria bacterium]|nr:DUF2075 domain-containing protein [Pseudomonadota bacterium]